MEQWTECFVGVRRVAICIPNPFGGQPIELFWYGVLASVGIFLGAYYAAKHIEWEGADSNIVWDALLWVLIPALVGARLWYVGQVLAAGGPAAQVYLQEPLQIINFRAGGMNIFGGIVFGMVALIIYARQTQVAGWLLADAALMGALIGQGIGRIGNWVNQELYGPPTELPWGIRIPAEARLSPWTDLATYPVETTRFHPTFFYEAFWLFLSFGILFYIFRRHQDKLVPGVITGAYLVLAGIGRFWIEWFRPDQPRIPLNPPYDNISFGRLFAIVYVFVGALLLLDRFDKVRIPGLKRPAAPPGRRRTSRVRATRRRRPRSRVKPRT